MILFDIKADLYGLPSERAEDFKPFQSRVAVSAVFERVEPLQAQLDRIASFGEPMRRLCELANVFESLREFARRVGDLSKALEPMRDFQGQLRQLPQRFTQLEVLDRELQQL